MSRVRGREMELLFGLDEVLDGGSWPVAERYLEWGGVIYPRDVVHKPTKDDPDAGLRITTARPLAERNAFLSFARLAARGKPSKDAILDWVHQYGLLYRREPNCAHAYLPNGYINQEPMKVEDFQDESGRAYLLLRIFELWRAGDMSKLRPRITLRRLHPPGEPRRVKNAEVLLDGEPTPYIVRIVRKARKLMDEKDLTDETVLGACKATVQAAIEPDIAGVRPAFGIDGRLAFRCPDLHTALFWQFACLVGGKRPTDICDGCGQVFVKDRKNKYVCNATCRSRKHRKSDSSANSR